MEGEVLAHAGCQAMQQPEDRRALAPKVRARQGQGVRVASASWWKATPRSLDFDLYSWTLISYEDLEAPMRFVLDVFGDGPTAGFGVLEERCTAGARIPDRIAILIPDFAGHWRPASNPDLRRAETAVLLEVLDLGHRDALVIGLHLATLRAGVDDQGLCR